MRKRVVCSVLLLLLAAAPAYAQSHDSPDWLEAFKKRSPGGGGGAPQSWFDSDDEPKQRPSGEPIRDGGPRPAISPQTPPMVDFPYAYAANSIVIDAGGRKLYYVLGGNRAYQYSVGVGREGFGWTGSEKVSRKQAWPDWHPPKEMRERDPGLPEKMTGGVRNPLGAVAIYLGNTLYRIHGTNDARSIGRAQSSGCFRMMNASAVHLAQQTQIGTTVAVVKSLPRGPRVSAAPREEQSGNLTR
jgi:lipoprotein-anchoring transpeptidase ErfK/SrfK